MKPEQFIEGLDEAQIVAAIAKAERKTSGEIRVYVSHKKREDILVAARRRFHKLAMTKTRQRNAVLIYFAPLTRKLARHWPNSYHQLVTTATNCRTRLRRINRRRTTCGSDLHTQTEQAVTK